MHSPWKYIILHSHPTAVRTKRKLPAAVVLNKTIFFIAFLNRSRHASNIHNNMLRSFRVCSKIIWKVLFVVGPVPRSNGDFHYLLTLDCMYSDNDIPVLTIMRVSVCAYALFFILSFSFLGPNAFDRFCN